MLTSIFAKLFPRRPSFSESCSRQDGSLILAIPFGSHHIGNTGNPAGASNQAIAQIAGWTKLELELPIIGQWEFQDAQPPLEMVHVIGAPGDQHIPSQRFFTEALEHTPAKKVILVAHPDHAHRCQLILEKMGVSSVVPAECAEIPYDPNSTQPWCRNKWFPLPIKHPTNPKKWGFFWFECVARLHHTIKGWI